MGVESYTAHLARRSAEWVVWITIEGVGDEFGLWRFCNRVPRWAASHPAWKPWLLELPPPLSSRVNQAGEFEAGALEFAVLDPGDALTALLRLHDYAATELATAATAADLQLVLTDSETYGGGWSEPDLAFLGAEACRVELIAADTLDVARGFLDTNARPQAALTLVREHVPNLDGRRVRLHLGAYDSHLVAHYKLDDVSGHLRDSSGCEHHGWS